MALRARLRDQLRRLLGRPAPPPSPPATPARSAAPAAVPPAPPAARPAAPSAPPPTSAAPPAQSPAPSPVAPAARAQPSEAELEAKAAKHLEKTRRGLLQHVSEAGGQLSLGDLHSYSERRFFIGHKKFSDLMESMVEAGQLRYDAAAGIATLEPAGQAYLSGDKA